MIEKIIDEAAKFCIIFSLLPFSIGTVMGILSFIVGATWFDIIFNISIFFAIGIALIFIAFESEIKKKLGRGHKRSKCHE